MHSKNTTPTPSRPWRRFVRLSRRSRACTSRKPEDRTLRRCTGALAENIRTGRDGRGKSRLQQMRENAENGQNRGILDAAARKRRESGEKAARKQDKTTGSCAPRGGHICPRCGQFQGFARAFQKQRKTALGRCSTKKSPPFQGKRRGSNEIYEVNAKKW